MTDNSMKAGLGTVIKAHRTVLRLPGLLLLAALAGCTAKEAIKAPVNLLGALFGRLPPPPPTSVLQELRQEYETCLAEGGNAPDCTRLAYDTVRTVKNLDERALPTGSVTIREVSDTDTAAEPTPASSTTAPSADSATGAGKAPEPTPTPA